MLDFLEGVGAENPGVAVIEGRGIKDLSGLVDAYAADRKFIDSGGNVKIPGEGASTEERSTFHQLLGAHGSAEGYVVPDSGDPVVNAILEGLRDVAHSQGVSGQQWDAITGKIGELNTARVQEATTQQAAKRLQWEQEARLKYGVKADEKLAIATRAENALTESDPQMKQMLQATGLNSNPAFLNLLIQAGSIAQSDTTPDQGQEGAQVDDHLTEAIEMAEEARRLVGTIDSSKRKDPTQIANLEKYNRLTKQLCDWEFEGCQDKRLMPQTV